jgi:hypothetical protein
MRGFVRGTVVALALLGAEARAQGVGVVVGGQGATFITPGSTVQGDIDRGIGVMAAGLGQYNYLSAMGYSINADTAIKLNEYIAGTEKAENRENARIKRERLALERELYNKILDRITNHPELADVTRGDTLNDKKDRLLNKGSILRFSAFEMPGDAIRQIPFAYREKGATFSMQRLAPRRLAAWPPALRDSRLDREREKYEHSVDRALQQIEDKQALSALRDVEKAVKELWDGLDRVAERRKDPIYLDARNYLRRLDKDTEVLKTHELQRVLVEIEHYGGTTLGDLIEFMHRNHLRFGTADPGAETQLYRKLDALMGLQLDRLEGGDPVAKK